VPNCLYSQKDWVKDVLFSEAKTITTRAGVRPITDTEDMTTPSSGTNKDV